ncbi:UNKNOWN [Stylonychia lemnae]|uniref:Uncharacterized protein n=1 Tax=Stylonychia lemnae TaxID=5949 RepID=A0A078A946_STYLE|nr:UNKNOWN [Stylonychia lemnae]|eukprot:CDW78749.1 UNKNOWN [Stylonychia lemnae]
MQGDSDLQLLINQQDQIQNILSSFHQAGTLTGVIIDFTIVNNSTLYLLYQQHVIVVDISQLTNSKLNGLPQLIDQIAIQGPFNRIEAAYDNKYLVLTHKNKAQILQINLQTQEQFIHRIENEDQRSIRDIHINKNYICILFDKNEVAVFDISHKQRVFRAVFRDATAQVTRLFYIKDFEDDVDYNDEIEEEYNRFKDDEIVDDKPRLFQGYFLFVENQIIKSQNSNISSSGSKAVKSTSIQSFEKICLVKAINNSSAGKIQKQGTINSKNQTQEQQSLHSQDFLKISEKTAKLVEYNEKRGIIFLLNQEKPSQNMILYTIKLKIADDHDSDSDDAKKRVNLTEGYKFWFIKEMRLNLNYSIIQAINTSSGHRKPKILKVVRRPNTRQSKEEFYIYVAIGNQVLCYLFDYKDFIPNDQNIKQYAEGGAELNFQQSLIKNNILDQLMGAQKNQAAFSDSLFDKDYFSTQNPGVIISQKNIQLQETISVNDIQPQFRDNFTAQSVVNDHQFQQTQSYLEKILKMEYPTIEDELTNQIEDHLQNEQYNNEIDEDFKAQQEQVKQELDKAIEDVLKDDIVLQSSSLMMEEELKNDAVSQLNPELVVKVSEESKQSNSSQQEANTKNATATETPQSQAQPTGGKKKKNKNKNKNNAGNNTQNVQQQQQQNQIPSQTQNQTQQVSQNQSVLNNQTSAVNNQTSNAAQNNQQNAQSVKKIQKTPQEQMIDNYQELTRKYQDLAQKISSMQRQVQNQSNQQIEIDKSISKNIKAVLPGIIQQQLQETVVPEMIKNIKSVDKQIKEQVMPQVENQIQDIFAKLIENGLIQQSNNNKQNAEKQKSNKLLQDKQIDDSEIKAAIMQQFEQTMKKQIKPMLENQLKHVVESAQQSLLFANIEFENRLRQEEEKNKQMMEYYISKLDQMMEANQNKSLQMNRSFKQSRPLGSPVYYPGQPDLHMPPPQSYHNAYYPIHPGQLPFMYEMGLQKSASYHPHYNLNAYFTPQQFQVEGLQKQIDTRFSSKLLPNSDDDDENEVDVGIQEENKNSDGEYGLPDELDENTKQSQSQYRQLMQKAKHQSVLMQNSYAKQQISPIMQNQFIQESNINLTNANQMKGQISNVMTANGQAILMFNEDEITPLQGRSSNKLVSKDSSFISTMNMNSNTNKKTQNSQVKVKQTGLTTQQIIQQVQQKAAAQPKPQKQGSKGKGGEFEHILTYFKQIANGLPKQLDQLYKNKPFLTELNNFLKNNISELNGLHQNIISQFMKKIYDRSMMEDATNEYKKEGLKIYKRLNSRVCKQREDMKQLLPKIMEMEKALKEQIQE